MSDTLKWRVQGFVRDAMGRNGVQYVIYGGADYTVVARLADPAQARRYLATRSVSGSFGDPNARYGKQARRRRQRTSGSHGKTVVLKQDSRKTLAGAIQLAERWHSNNV